EVTIAIREAKVHLDALASGTYDIAFVTTLLDVVDPVSALGDFVHNAPNNFPHWHSETFDQLVNEAAQLPDTSAQAPLLARAETLLLDEAPIAPLYFNTQNWLMSPRVKGWQQDPLWNRRYETLRIDEN